MHNVLAGGDDPKDRDNLKELGLDGSGRYRSGMVVYGPIYSAFRMRTSSGLFLHPVQNFRVP
jgi:hypothetical protein